MMMPRTGTTKFSLLANIAVCVSKKQTSAELIHLNLLIVCFQQQFRKKHYAAPRRAAWDRRRRQRPLSFVYAFPSAANSRNSCSASGSGLRPLTCIDLLPRAVFTAMIESFSITYDPETERP
jgi:hypothetical protein